MSFAAPAFFLAGALAALAVVVLHFLARQRPRAAPFPTARFVPERTARAPSRALQPTDLLLLLLRALAVLLLGAAFARPALEGARQGTRRIVLVDRSQVVASAEEARDSARAWLRPGDALVLFDSAPRVIADRAEDSLRALALQPRRGALSGALVAAQQAAALLATRADSLELVLVSPIGREELDDATWLVRAQWPGVIRHVRVPAPRDVLLLLNAILVRGPNDDPLRSAGLANRASGSSVRIARGAVTRSDSAWAADSGGMLVRWPSSLAGGDSANALIAGNTVVVARFARDSLAAGGTPVAWWNDGRVAAAERRTRTGCVRDVRVGVPAAGDLVLRESFRRAFDALIAPCDRVRDPILADDSIVAKLRGTGSLAPARAWTRTSDAVPPLSRGLLLGAAVLLVAEPLFRRRAE